MTISEIFAQLSHYAEVLAAACVRPEADLDVLMGDKVAEFRWTNTGIVSEGEFFAIGGENVWSYKWVKAEDDSVQLPHPSYPTQMHRFSVYRVAMPSGEVRFAAAEVSPNVWAFYV